MAKDKKKEKKEKKVKKEKDLEKGEAITEALNLVEEKQVRNQQKVQDYSLNSALKASKTTESTLQDLLLNLSKGEGFYSRENIKEEKVEPRLSFENKKSNLVEEFLMEDVPLSERKLASIRPKKDKGGILLETSETKPEKSTQIEEKTQLQQPSGISTSPSPTSPTFPSSIPHPIESLSSSSRSLEQPLSVSEEENIYLKLGKFFTEQYEGYYENYARWENSISNVLSILRKMRKITKKNTEDLVDSINNMYEKIQTNLEQFKLKRDEIEKLSDVDIENMSREFKKVLGLLELQIKNYLLKKEMDDFIHRYKAVL